MRLTSILLPLLHHTAVPVSLCTYIPYILKENKIIKAIVMSEKEIQFITDLNLNKVNIPDSSFTIEKLFNKGLHPSLIQYISGRLSHLIFEERKVLLENSRFNYSGTKIAEYFNLIADEIKKTKKLSFAEMKKFIEKGVAFNANFVVNPKSTLINLIFKNADETKSASEIKIYLNYLYYYDYLKEIINSYLSKKNIADLDKSDFISILNKIDKELLSSGFEEIISDALNSISDFYNDGGASKSSVQAALVEEYLKEKGLDKLAAKLQVHVKENKKRLEINELKKILFAKSIASEVQEAKSEKKSEEEEKNKIESKGNFLPGIEFEEEKIPLKKEPASDIKPAEIEETIESETKDILFEPNNKNIQEEIIEEQIIEEAGNRIDINEISEAALEEDISIPRKRDKDIFSFLTKKDIEKIVSIIFNEDRDDFANTMEKLSECQTYDQASEILKSVFFTYRINPYKKEAVTLTNAVSNYYGQGN